jgi:hypothetical protein
MAVSGVVGRDEVGSRRDLGMKMVWGRGEFSLLVGGHAISMSADPKKTLEELSSVKYA